jgi:hypothetical protein
MEHQETECSTQTNASSKKIGKITLNPVTVSYTETAENNLAVEIFKKLKSKVHVRVNYTDKYCPVDFTITSLTDKTKRVFVELKTRQASYKQVKTLIIGVPKLKLIDKYKLDNSIITWGFNDGTYIFIEYNAAFINYKSRIIQNSAVIDIPVCKCGKNIDNLCTLILNKLDLN